MSTFSSRTPSSRNAASSGGGSSAALQTPENVNVPRTVSVPSKPSKSSGNRSSSSGGGSNAANSQSDAAGGAGGGSGGGVVGGSLAVDADGSGKKNATNATTAATASGAYANPFQAYLSNLSPEHGAGRSLNIDLSTALSGAEAINQLIADPERVKSLIVHLPESEDADEDRKQQIKDHISSPQFQQALAQFSNALQSAQLGPVVKQFELSHDAVAAAYSGNLEEFVRALEKSLPAGATMAADDTTPTSASKDTPVAEKKNDAEESAAAAAASADKPDEKK